MSKAVAVVALPAALLGVVLLTLLGGFDECVTPGDGGTLSSSGRSSVPPAMARIYQQQAERWTIDVAFLASIGAQETDHGRHPAANAVNSAGCQGVMQLGIGGRCGDFWGRNKCDGNNDGRENILEPADNVCAAAKGLRGEKGAPPTGGSYEAYYQAACGYYGACRDAASNYATEVMARAESYGFKAGTATDPAAIQTQAGGPDATGCGIPASFASGGEAGQLVIAPGANRPGAPLHPALLAFAERMASFLPRPLHLTTGTSHAQFSLSGKVSDHWVGLGADFGSVANEFPATGGGYGDQIAQAAWLAAGESPASSATKARAGGAITTTVAGYRIQIIWKSQVGGNHDNHIHVGLKPLATASTTTRTHVVSARAVLLPHTRSASLLRSLA